MVTHTCLQGHNYLALLFLLSFQSFQFYFINKPLPYSSPSPTPPKKGFGFGCELVWGSELKLFMESNFSEAQVEARDYFERNCTPYLNAALRSPMCSWAAVTQLLLTMEKYELGNGQKILVNRKKENLWGSCNVCFRKRCLATTKQTISLTKSTGWNLSVQF